MLPKHFSSFSTGTTIAARKPSFRALFPPSSDACRGFRMTSAAMDSWKNISSSQLSNRISEEEESDMSTPTVLPAGPELVWDCWDFETYWFWNKNFWFSFVIETGLSRRIYCKEENLFVDPSRDFAASVSDECVGLTSIDSWFCFSFSVIHLKSSTTFRWSLLISCRGRFWKRACKYSPAVGRKQTNGSVVENDETTWSWNIRPAVELLLLRNEERVLPIFRNMGWSDTQFYGSKTKFETSHNHLLRYIYLDT